MGHGDVPKASDSLASVLRFAEIGEGLGAFYRDGSGDVARVFVRKLGLLGRLGQDLIEVDRLLVLDASDHDDAGLRGADAEAALGMALPDHPVRGLDQGLDGLERQSADVVLSSDPKRQNARGINGQGMTIRFWRLSG